MVSLTHTQQENNIILLCERDVHKLLKRLQGVGRAVRSGSDHCAVFISDNSLLQFIGIEENREFFNSTKRSQIDFGLELFGDNKPNTRKEALTEIFETERACLTGDPPFAKGLLKLSISIKITRF